MKNGIIKTKIIPGILTAAFVLSGVGVGNSTPFLMKSDISKVYAEETETSNNINKIILNINKPENATENVKINGEEVTADALTITYSKGMTLPQDVKCKGYTFKGWYYGDINISGNASLTVSGSSDSITVDGKWEEGEPEEVKDSFIITLDANGGTVTPEQITVKKDSNETITLPIPKREGYIFDGWYIGEEKVTSNTPLTEDITFVANWTKYNKYTLTFDADGGKLTLTELQFRENENIISPTPAKLGYEFIGWYVGDEKLKDTYTYGKDVEAKAKWEPKTYTITYENVDGWKNTNPTSYVYGDSVNLIAPTKEGFIFDGWYNKSSNQKATGIGEGSATDYVFVAKWHEATETAPQKKIKLTFDTDGGNIINYIEVSPEETVLLPTPIKEGFIFDGWYILDKKVPMMQTFDTDTTLIAHWKKEAATDDTDKDKQTEILNKAKGILTTFTAANTTVKSGSSIELPKKTIAAKDGNVVTIPENGILTLSEGKYAIMLPGDSTPYVFTVANITSNDSTNDKDENKGSDNEDIPTDKNNDTSNNQDTNLLILAKTALDNYAKTGVKIGDKVTLPNNTLITRDGIIVTTPDNVLNFDKAGNYIIVLPDGSRYVASVIDNNITDSKTNTNTNSDENGKALEAVKNSLNTYKSNGINIGDKLNLPEGSNVTRDDVAINIPDKTLTFDKTGVYAIYLPDGTKYTITLKNSTFNPTKVTGIKIKAKKKKVIIKYKKIKDISGYEIQISTKKNFKSVKTFTTKKNSYTIKKLKSGKKYYVRIRTYKKNTDGIIIYSKWSTAKRTKKVK